MKLIIEGTRNEYEEAIEHMRQTPCAHCLVRNGDGCIPVCCNARLRDNVEFREIRWRAHPGCIYYYVAATGEVYTEREAGNAWGDRMYELGNYYRTREEADEAAGRVRKVYLIEEVDHA